jgi:uncharacterized cofD-like protein
MTGILVAPDLDNASLTMLKEAGAASGVAVEIAMHRPLEGADDETVLPSCVVLAAVEAEAPGFAVLCDRVRQLVAKGVAVVLVGAPLTRPSLTALFAAGAREVLSTPLHKRELILRLGAVLQKKLRVACIGGGTGLYTVLDGMKDAKRVLLGSIVTMSDDGGSSGQLRASFGILPPGDVRRSLVALSNAPEVMSYVMQYRFAGGEGLSGHSLGNLLLTALCELTGSMQNAVKTLGDILNVQGLVMCVTESATLLCAEFEDGRTVRGESAIDRGLERPDTLRIRKLWHEPAAETTADVFASLLAADLIVIGPGDLYTSLLAALSIDGVPEAIRKSRAKCLYICNLMTKPGETSGYDAADHAAAIVETLGEDALDYVLVSCTELDPDAVHSYAGLAQHPVVVDLDRLKAATRAEAILGDIGHRAQLVRHDSIKVRSEILDLLFR